MLTQRETLSMQCARAYAVYSAYELRAAKVIILLYRPMHRNFMKLEPARSDGRNLITAYGEAYVTVNATRYAGNVVVLPDRIIPDWTAASFDTLTPADFEFLAGLGNAILLLGTGPQLRFPRPELLAPLARRNKSLEVMDLRAACRTYNLLIGEGRDAVAALLLS